MIAKRQAPEALSKNEFQLCKLIVQSEQQSINQGKLGTMEKRLMRSLEHRGIAKAKQTSLRKAGWHRRHYLLTEKGKDLFESSQTYYQQPETNTNSPSKPLCKRARGCFTVLCFLSESNEPVERKHINALFQNKKSKKHADPIIARLKERGFIKQETNGWDITDSGVEALFDYMQLIGH